MSLVACSAWARFLTESKARRVILSYKGKLQRRLSSMVLPGTQLLFFSPAKWQISQGRTTPMSMELTFSILTDFLHNPCQGFPNPSQIWIVKLNISVAHLSRVWMKVSTHSFCLALLGGCLFVYWFVLVFSPQSQTSSSIALLYRSYRIYVAL